VQSAGDKCRLDAPTERANNRHPLSVGDELVLRARADSEQYLASGSAPATEALRAEANALFESLPEPPAYRKANDPAREKSRQLLPKATELLARLFAAQKAHPDEASLASLTQAVEAHLRALAAMAAGEITEGDHLAREAWQAARVATRSGSFFQMQGPQSEAVYDRATGTSRYDPRPEPMLTVQLFCPNEGCRQPAPYSLSPNYAIHRFSCSACKRPFTGHFAELRGVEARSTGRPVHYTLHVVQVGGGDTVLEFDDVSGGDLAAAPRDLIVLLYAGTGTLAAVENLTTGRVLWIQPKGACFVATAVFGEDAPELVAFRRFRDEVLLPRPWGRLFVRAYYASGPTLVRGLDHAPLAREAVRRVLLRIHARLVER
jgi:hypothetical protein